MTSPSTLYILRGLDASGNEYFYTGKAGDGWVSQTRAASFGYVSHTQATHKATMFNKLGLAVRFIVQPFAADSSLAD